MYFTFQELQNIKANQEKEALENKIINYENNIVPLSNKSINEQNLNFTSENLNPQTFSDSLLKNEPLRFVKVLFYKIRPNVPMA